MPNIRKLSPEEITARETSKLSLRKQNARQYDAMLADFEVGEWGEIGFEAGDKRTSVRNRLLAAAQRRGVAIAFRRGSGSMVRFEVEAPQTSTVDEKPVSPVPEPEPERKQPGRKKKVAA